MQVATLGDRLLHDDGRPSLAGWAVVVCWLECLSLLGYFALTPAEPRQVRYLLYPFLWINAGLLAVALTSPPEATRSRRVVAGVLAGAYFLLLASVSGMVDLYGGGGHHHAVAQGFQVVQSAPGWGPRVGYVTAVGHVNLVPYRVVGYLALAYLGYVVLLRATATAVSGVFGLASCVGCAFPVVTATSGGAAAGSAAALSTVSRLSADISTAAFLAAVGLLYWGATR